MSCQAPSRSALRHQRSTPLLGCGYIWVVFTTRVLGRKWVETVRLPSLIYGLVDLYSSCKRVGRGFSAVD